MAFAWTIWAGLIALTAQAYAGTADPLCGEDPARAICTHSETQPLALRLLKRDLQIRALRTSKIRCGLKPYPGVEPEEKAYEASFEDADEATRLCVMQVMNEVAFAEVKKRRGVDFVDMQAYVEKAKQALTSIVQEENAFSAQQTREIEREIAATHFVTANMWDAYSGYTGSMLNTFAYYCDLKFSPRAFLNYGYSEFLELLLRNHFKPESPVERRKSPIVGADVNMIVACPGVILELLHATGDDPFESWHRIVGHEIAHSFHAYLNKQSYIERTHAYDPELKDYSPDFRAVPETLYWEPYAGMLACFREQFSPTAPGASNDPQDLLKPKYPDESWNNSFKAILGRPADAVESYITELSADHWGVKLATRLIQDLPPASRARAIRNSLKLWCPIPSLLEWLYSDMTGAHPSLAFRMRNALRYPELRQAIGCESDQAPYGRRWCSMH